MTTLSDLRLRARQRADMVNSQFVTDAELDTYINNGLLELYDLVVNAFEDYFTLNTNFTVSSGDTYTLPDNFYKLRGLDFSVNGTWSACREFEFNDRNKSQSGVNALLSPASLRSYRILGDTILLQPSQSATGLYRLWYVPALTALSTGTDTIHKSLSKFGWDEYVVLWAAERMLSKEESSVTDVRQERGELTSRITEMAKNRQVDQSGTIQDVSNSWTTGRGWDEP